MPVPKSGGPFVFSRVVDLGQMGWVSQIAGVVGMTDAMSEIHMETIWDNTQDGPAN